MRLSLNGRSQIVEPKMDNRSAGRKITTLIYCVHNDSVLLIQRKKYPFIGMWTAPGGKVELGESPHAGARRELLEETGLLARTLDLKAVISEVSPRPDWHWLMFAYVVRDFSGDLMKGSSEGELSWWPLAKLEQLSMPDADRVFMPLVLKASGVVEEITFTYDADCNMVEWTRDRRASQGGET